MEIMSGNSVMEELPGRPALLAARADDGENAFVPSATHFGTAALRQSLVQDRMADGLFGGVVGRRDQGVEQKAKQGAVVFADSPGQTPRMFRQILPLCQNENPILDFSHHRIEPFFGDFIAPVPQMKQSFKLAQEQGSEGFFHRVRKRIQKFNITDQMSQAKLLKAIGVFDVGAEKVADDGAGPRRPQYLIKHFGRTRPGQDKQTDGIGGENPEPVFDPLVFPAGFIDVQNRRGAHMLAQFVIRRLKRRADAGNHVAQETSGNRQPQNVPGKILQSAVGRMQRPFHVRRQCRQAGSEQGVAGRALGQIGIDNPVADRTAFGIPTMFGDPDRLFHQFGLLMNSRFQKRLAGEVVALGTMIWNMLINLIDLIQGKGLTMNPVVSGLTALLSRLAVGRLGLGRFNDVRRRRFGGIRGIFRKFSELLGKKCDFLFQRGDPLLIKLSFILKRFESRFHRPVLTIPAYFIIGQARRGQ